MPMMPRQRLGAAVAGLAALAVGAVPSWAADATQGEQLAHQWCASCHLLPGATQPVPQGPPTFRDLAHHDTPDHLRSFLMRPHGSMPPLSLSRTEIDDLVAYIDTLR